MICCDGSPVHPTRKGIVIPGDGWGRYHQMSLCVADLLAQRLGCSVEIRNQPLDEPITITMATREQTRSVEEFVKEIRCIMRSDIITP